MKRFYIRLAHYLKNYVWGRSVVNHINRHPLVYENVEALYTTLIFVLLFKAFLFDAYKIPSSSMENTLQINDRIFVNKFIYDFTDVEVGDIVVFKTQGLSIYDPEKPYYIKRVTGVAGDTIEITQDGYIIRNGELLDNPEFIKENFYVPYRGRTKFTVPEGEIYMFGDNSEFSFDSRAWGGVPLENVVGQAVFRYWPIPRFGLLYGELSDSAARNIEMRTDKVDQASPVENMDLP